MDPVFLASFNQWISWAQQDLSHLPPADEAPTTRAFLLKHARKTLANALTAANRLRCPARKAMCLRVLNWLNAEIRRLPA